MKSKKGAIISTVVFLVILIAIAAVVYIVFRGSFEESGKALMDEAAKNARTDLLGLKLALLKQPVGEDECGNALGNSIRSTGTSCEAGDNNAPYSSSIRDCCCCNVTTHIFDFGKIYAYKAVEFKFVPRNTSDTFEVEGRYSLYPDPSGLSFKVIPGCDKTFNMSDLQRLDKSSRMGFTLSCYIGSNLDIEDAQFRYASLEVLNVDGDIDYAEAKVYPAVRICNLSSTDDLEPGKGYWVYSTLSDDKNVTILGWDYLSPIAIIYATPQSTLTYEIVHFDGSASFSPAPGCGISSYAWDFGDGNSGVGKFTTHTYTENGTFKVKLTVKENNFATLGCDGSTGTSYTYITVLDQYPHALFDMYYSGFYSEEIYGTGP